MIGENVQTLLRNQIESYEELELLIYLYRHPDEDHSIGSLMERLHLSGPAIHSALAALVSADLVVKASSEFPYYRFAPRTPALHRSVADLANAYSERLIEIVKLMSANAIERVRTKALRTFADAFILRKDKDRG